MLDQVVAYFLAHKQALIMSIKQFRSSFLASMVLIVVIGIALSLPICLFVASNNAKVISKGWPYSSQLSVFLDKDLSQQDTEQFLTKVRTNKLVAFANYISPKQGLQTLEQQTGMNDVSHLLSKNPLPAVIEVHPVVIRKNEIENLYVELKKIKGASQVKMDLQWLMRLESMLELAKQTASGLMILLCFAVLLVVGNTIRLAVINRRKEVEILKLIGATNAYIRRPFLYFGMIYGFLGALLAWLGITCVIFYLQYAATKLASLYYTHFELIGLSFSDGGLLLIVGTSLGFIGSYLSVWQQLNRADEQSSHGF